MSHLGERLTALVDGELGHEERDRALAHLAACEQCRAEAEALRRLKSQLRGLRGVVPEPGLLGRLNAMGDPAHRNLLRDSPGAMRAHAGPPVA
ncbi:anti-sigma factor family protein, partial [Actinomadura sp. HBU206391]|uniref:anti-sigma factor family protein n=1 Tax=Actinomadura sp. HBU206391 TaxID=2731692 RepID=UPI00164F2904